jgi:hypothetical protein
MNNSSDVAALLGRTNELLAILVKAELGPLLARETAKPEFEKLYDLTGGDQNIYQIATTTGMSKSAISRVWIRWEEMGLLIKSGKSYRRAVE